MGTKKTTIHQLHNSLAIYGGDVSHNGSHRGKVVEYLHNSKD